MPKKTRICCNPLFLSTIVVLALFVISTFFLPSTNDTEVEITLDSFNHLANKDDFFHHVEDMQRLQKSIILELSKLEQKRNKLRTSVTKLETHNIEYESQLKYYESSIAQLKVDVRSMLLTHAETLKDYPPISIPQKLNPSSLSATSLPNKDSQSICTFDTCFDYSRCSVLSNFPIYLYPISTDNPLLASFKMSLTNSRHITHDPDQACIYLVLHDDGNLKYDSLPYWHGDGHNHVIVNTKLEKLDLPSNRAILAQVEFFDANINSEFSVTLPKLNSHPVKYNQLPLLLPVRKEYLISHYGRLPTTGLDESSQEFINAFTNLHSEAQSVNIMKGCAALNPSCNSEKWCLCSDHKSKATEKQSTFSVIPNTRFMPQSEFGTRLNVALMSSSVPIIIGTHYKLPMADVIQWNKAVVSLPSQRVTEMVYIIRNILEPDIMEYKKQGRLIFENHLCSIPKVTKTLINLLRSRINIPPPPAPTPISERVYGENHPMLTFQAKSDHNKEEIYGPIEDPYPSAVFQRNFTAWQGSQPNAIGCDTLSNLYPFTPWDPILPTDAKYYGSSYGFRPVNGGAGGSGREFSLSLGGNYPREQYTIVILTYDRAELLQQQLAQFNGLPYLNKVVIVWNNPSYPAPTLQWPKLHVPIQVIKASRNTLNNRFMPYKEIETEAVLSMDDDMYLRHDEIIFAFRVWRESRDRIVGFPGRYHAWNMNEHKWNYNSNHSCELSMILTGAAFFHKYYMYQYTYEMSQAIRDKVDEFMNCEDIAMNFLVSHITGKPPIKTTSRWTFRCATCGDEALWIDESHFNERHQCIQFFTQVYGYLPLVYTQYRADSVLFKTRLPQDKTKCFTLV